MQHSYHELKQFICQYYEGLSQGEISDRVKLEIIPALITIFFHHPSPVLTPKLQNRPIQKQALGKQDKYTRDMKENRLHLGGEKMEKILGIGLLFLFGKLSCHKTLNSSFYTIKSYVQQQIHAEERLELKKRGILQLRYLQIKKVIFCFYKGYEQNRRGLRVARILKRIQVNTLSLSFKNIHSQAVLKQRNFHQIGASLICRKLKDKIRSIFDLLKLETTAVPCNRKKVEIIRHLSLRSPISLQLSLWRMKNYAQKLSIFSKLTLIIERERLKQGFTYLSMKNIIPSSSLTRSQSLLLVCEGLEYLERVSDISLMMEGWQKLESLLY